MNPGLSPLLSANAKSGNEEKLRLKIPDVTMSHALSRKVTTEKRRGEEIHLLLHLFTRPKFSNHETNSA